MLDYSDYSKMISELEDTQSDEQIRREHSLEAHKFLEERDGQWDPEIFRKMSGRPRMTYDKCTPIRNQIAGEMEQADFDIKVRPAGGDATKELAKLRDGMIRNIENMSNAVEVFNHASRSNVTGGIDGCRVVVKFVESDSFDKDLIIEHLSNFLNRVWFDRSSEKQDRSDADFCWDIQSIALHTYNERWPEGSAMSVSTLMQNRDNQQDQVIIGEFLYKKPVDINLALMSNGKVYLAEQLEPVKDDLEAQGITVADTRTRKGHLVYSRLFDGSDWLEAEEKTIFEWLPIVPIYGNFRMDEDNKPVYFGIIEKLMDAQRSINYYGSRDLEEVALSPRAKYWLTKKQATGNQDTLATMNTNQDPYQIYNTDESAPPPQQQGGAVVNQGLQIGLGNASNALQEASGLPPANMGLNPLMQSGTAIELQQSKGDTGTIHWFKAREIFICQVARILVNALPKHYDNKRSTRILNEDGSFEMVSLNDEVFDADKGEMVVLNDLSIGQYDVTCDSGPSFKNRQQETAKALVQLSEIVPGVAEVGADVLLNSIQAPGVNIIAERIREKMVQSGAIPFSQLTDDEKAQQEEAQAIAAQQPSEPTPEEKIGEAELKKSEANTADTISKIEDRDKRFELDRAELELKADEAEDKSQLEAIKVEQTEEMNLLKMQQQQFDQAQQTQEAIVKALSAQASTLKTLTDAVSNLAGPHTLDAAVHQAGIVTESQQDFEQPADLQHSTSLSDNQNL